MKTKSNYFAPIFVVVYNRVKHFKDCVNSLKDCKEAKDSILYISSDAPSKKSDIESVNEIREYIKSIKGFKKVIPILHSQNLGNENAVLASWDIILKSHDAFIALEDDVKVSNIFLRELNSALVFYKNEENIFSICGFNPKILTKSLIKENSIYFSNRWNAWGYAAWSKKFESFLDYRQKKLKDKSSYLLKKYQFNKTISSDGYTNLLHSKVYNKLPEFDHSVEFYCLEQKMYNVHYNNTLSVNIGHDGHGSRNLKSNTITNKMNLNFIEDVVLYKKFNESLYYQNAYKFVDRKFISFIKNFLIITRTFELIKKYYRKIIK